MTALPLVETHLMSDELDVVLKECGIDLNTCYIRWLNNSIRIILGHGDEQIFLETVAPTTMTSLWWAEKRKALPDWIRKYTASLYSKLPPLEEDFPELGVF